MHQSYGLKCGVSFIVPGWQAHGGQLTQNHTPCSQVCGSKLMPQSGSIL